MSAEKDDKEDKRGFVARVVGGVDEMHAAGEFAATGTMFMTHLLSMYVGIRGFAEDYLHAAAPVFWSEMNLSTALGQDYTSRIYLPWSMKALWAAMSDLLPIAGYKKRFYFIFWASAGVFAFALLTFTPFDVLKGGPEGNAFGAFLLFFLGNACIAACDSLTQGKYSEVAKAKGSAVVSFVYGTRTVTSIFAKLSAGFLNDFNPKVAPALVMPAFGQMIPVSAVNCIGDVRREEGCAPDTELLRANPKAFIMGMCITLLALFMAFGNLFFSLVLDLAYGEGNYNSIWPRVGRASVGLVGASAVLMYGFQALPRRVACINIYLFLCRVMGVGYSFALLQFFTAPAEICPGRPNFPYAIYQGIGDTMGAVATLLGVWLFEKYVVHWHAPAAFWVTTAFTCVGALFDISMVEGFNRTILGWTGMGNVIIDMSNSDGTREVRLDDLAGYLFGTQALRSIVDTLDNLPSTLLLSKLCPKGLEATVFSILVALFNLGGSLSVQLGSIYLSIANVNIRSRFVVTEENVTYINETTGENYTELETVRTAYCDLGQGLFGMNGLTFGLILGNIVLPLMTIPLTWIFIPNIRLDEDFVDLDEEGNSVELARDLVPDKEGQAGDSFTLQPAVSRGASLADTYGKDGTRMAAASLRTGSKML